MEGSSNESFILINNNSCLSAFSIKIFGNNEHIYIKVYPRFAGQKILRSCTKHSGISHEEFDQMIIFVCAMEFTKEERGVPQPKFCLNNFATLVKKSTVFKYLIQVLLTQ